MKSIRFKQFISLVLIFIMSFTTYGGSALANQSDIVGHWAEKQIQTSIEKGFVKGFPDGKFRPDAEITRAEFISLVNRKFMYTGKSKNVFPDVKANEWYANEVSAALAAGYIGGFEDGTMRPKAEITRQEVAAILTRILKLSKNDNAAKHFKDSIPTWSKGSIGAVSENKIMTGLPGGKFGPMKPITRAEAIVTLDRIPDPKITYNKAGTHGPKSGFETITNNVEITTDGVVLQNLVIEGNLHITKSVGEGDVILNNVTVKGTTIINGGGENSIHAENSTLNHVIVDKDNDKVRLVITGTSTISQVTLRSGAKLEEKDVTKNGFGSIIVYAPKDSRIDLKGKFESVTIDSSDVTVNLDAGSSVEKLTINKKATVTGNGTINQANVNADGVDLKITPAKVTVKDGVKYPGTTTPGTGGGGTVINPPPTSGGGDNNPPTGVTIERIEDITNNASVGDTIQLPTTVKAKMSNGTEVDQPIVWSGKAYTADVGIFEYEGAVEGYNRVVKYTLTVTLTGYDESSDGKVVTVSNDAALEHAQKVITVEEVIVTKDATLPAKFNLPITINAANVTLDLHGNSIEKVIVNGDNVTLKGGTIKEIIFGTNVVKVTLENISDLLTTIHDFKNIQMINLLGNTNLKGDMKLKGTLSGNPTARVSGVVRIDSSNTTSIFVPVTTVIVDFADAVVNIGDNITVEHMMVRKNATIKLGIDAKINNPEKRSNVTVNVENGTVQIASFRAQSSVIFEEKLDTADLNRYIQVAEGFVKAAQPGDLDGQFPQTAIDQLKLEKEIAIKKRDQIIQSSVALAAKQDLINTEVNNLQKSLDNFGETRKFVDTSSLKNKLRAMEQLLLRTSVGNTHGRVPQDAYNIFEKVVSEVKAAVLSGVNENEIGAQTKKLDDAHSAFKDAYIDLPFFDPDSSTVEGSFKFILPELNKGELFTDFLQFRVEDKKNKEYSTTGWSIHRGVSTDSGWAEMEVTKLNHHEIDLNKVDKVYYTVASNKRIYTGSFLVSDFKKQGEIKLTPTQYQETGTLKINVEDIKTNFKITDIFVKRTDANLDQRWEHSYQVNQTTNLPVGKYSVEVYAYDDTYEYLLKKVEINVNNKENSVTFTNSELDTVNLIYEDFTGWNAKASNYQALESNLRYSYHYLDENSRNLNSSIRMTDNFSGLRLEYFANHPLRDGEQWRYRIVVPRKENGKDEVITTSPHFQFDITAPSEETRIDSTQMLGRYFSIAVKNENGHMLDWISSYHDFSFLNYGGSITVKDKSGKTATKNAEYIWTLSQYSIQQIFPGASDEVEITFSMKDSPFIIEDKTFKVKLSN